MPSHYLNQCWVIVNWTLRNKFQWNINQNTKLFIHEKASENIVCKMTAILSRGDELSAKPGRGHYLNQWWPNLLTLIGITRLHEVNSLAPGKFGWNFGHVIFKQILVIDGWGISYEVAQIWMSLDFTEDQSTLVQVMAWCRQATSHYLSQCWPRSLLPYGVARPQWVNQMFNCRRW